MRRLLLAALFLYLTASVAPASDVALVPESEQAALAQKIIDAYLGPRPATPPKVLRVVYFTPADRDPAPDYEHRMETALEDIRTFYRDEMQRNGFGPETFQLERDPQGKFIIHLVKGKLAAKDYAEKWKENQRLIGDPCRSALKANGLSADTETLEVICNLANWDEKTGQYSHPTPYTGSWKQQWGFCWGMDSPIFNLDYLGKEEPVVDDFQFGKVPIGKRNGMLIGGMAHEMGHAFGLPHSGRRWDEVKTLNPSIMGMGNLTYSEQRPGQHKGVSLTMASAMRLAARPLFSGSDKGNEDKPSLDVCKVKFSRKVTRADLIGRRAPIRVEGTVQGSPPVYAVIAYFNSLRDGGYRSPAATAVPDADGRFAIETSDLARTTNGVLTVSFCHANGGVSDRTFRFNVSADGKVTGRQ